MACKYICDGCGKEKPADENWNGYHKPRQWYERSDDDGVQVACSRECIKVAAEKAGVHSLVLPV